MRVIALVVLLSGCLPVNNVDARKHGARKLRCNDGHSQIVIPSKGAIGTLTTGRDGLVTTTAASSAGLGSPSPSSSSSSSSTIPANNASGQIPTAPSSATSKNLPPSKQTTKAGRSTATSASARPSQPAPTSSNPAGSIKTTYTGPTSGRATFYGDDGNGGTCKLPARSDKVSAHNSGDSRGPRLCLLTHVHRAAVRIFRCSLRRCSLPGQERHGRKPSTAVRTASRSTLVELRACEHKLNGILVRPSV